MKLEINRAVKNKKSIRLLKLLLIFCLLLVGVIFLRGTPQFENFLVLLRSFPYEEKGKLDLNLKGEMGDVENIVALENGWGVHLTRPEGNELIQTNKRLEIKERKDTKAGGRIVDNLSRHGYWLLDNPGENIMVFDETGKLKAKINLDKEVKIASTASGVLLGENNMVIDNGFRYSEKLKWFNIRGELSKEVEIQDIIVLDGINNEVWDKKYVGIAVSEDPVFELIDGAKWEKEVLDFRLGETLDLFMEAVGEYIIIGNEKKLMLYKDDRQDLLELDGKLEQFIFLNKDRGLLLTKNKSGEEKVVIIGFSAGEFEIEKEHSLRGNTIDIYESNEGDIGLTTSTHFYSFSDGEINIIRNPWGKISSGAFSVNGSWFVSFNEEKEQLFLYEGIKDEK